jgi:uncharacterized membrane protein (UPF0127 family)
VATRLEAAFDRTRRNRGLLGRDRLEAGAALILAPCNAIHTWFMRFPIDVVFVRRDGRIVKTVAELEAWRVAASLRAFAVVELPAGTLAAADTRAGDALRLSEVSRGQ